MRDKGILTAEEFAHQKALMLDHDGGAENIGRPPSTRAVIGVAVAAAVVVLLIIVVVASSSGRSAADEPNRAFASAPADTH
jgi:hypothetical protein